MAASLWRPKTLNLDKPLYLAIADALEENVQSGILRPGEQLPPQRELADLIGVNVSTITRAFRECERRGLISGTTGRGTYISADIHVPVRIAPEEDSEKQDELLEMGQIFPLYSLDKDIIAETQSIMETTDWSPLLRYTSPAGLIRHRRVGAAWLERFGLYTSPKNILLTAGSQNALACCLMSLFNAGDRIAVDQLTYPGIKSLASLLGLRLVPLTMDEKGILPDSLGKACTRDHIRGIFLMPEVQNPTTVCIAPERREELASVIKKYDLILIEDESYGYTGSLPHTALSTMVPNQGIYLAGISKMLGAGFRISFAAVPSRFLPQVENALLNTVWMPSPLNGELVSQLLERGTGDEVMAAKRKEAFARTAMAQEKLSPYTIFSRPHGLFVWLFLPPEWTGREFELAAQAAGIRVFCAEKFWVGSGSCPSAVRISLTGPLTRQDLDHGLTILANLLAENPKHISSFL